MPPPSRLPRQRWETPSRPAFRLGATPAAVEESGDVVDADHLAAVPCRCDRGVAAAGGDVEHAPTRMQVGGVAEVLGHEHDSRGDDGEVAARPGCLLALLDRCQVGSGRVDAGHVQASVS